MKTTRIFTVVLSQEAAEMKDERKSNAIKCDSPIVRKIKGAYFDIIDKSLVIYRTVHDEDGKRFDRRAVACFADGVWERCEVEG